MKFPVQISFRNCLPSPAIEQALIERTAKLERFFDRMTHCSVIVECPHRHQSKGSLFRVRINVAVPGGELIVGHDGRRNTSHTNVYIAIADAFVAARRQLQDYAQVLRGNVKYHYPMTVQTAMSA